jgi:tRNA (mo5U34)-methyltransferase
MSEPVGLISHAYATADWDSDKIADYRAKVGRYAEQVGWFHSFDFGNGIVADGAASLVSLSKRITSLGFDGLDGRTFLDIASWDGFYAFEAERRGASRVLATDYFCWLGGGWGKKDGFILAREILQSKVADKDIEVQDLSPETVGMWDVVLFSGIFYHMRDPIRALAAAASVAKERLIVETHIYNDPLPVPLMQYLPRVPNNETSNYWRPNTAMILLLLKEFGFLRVEHRIEIDPPGGPDSTHGFFNAYRS